uniref:Plastid light harvesting protein n=1 Tax=Proboscia inermis TaxID=420281 RepID=A0A7S0C2J9_9STRA|mmetsp:Transcript_22830/g.23182  ORF Transcript_22830/g.23182 Transcript_22830/m.23182 type:complete len:201 (+) Transcript_22830:124-726(+)
MKTTILAALVASVAAFTPVPVTKTSSVLNAASFENEVGAQAPLGYFDPLGLLKGADQERFDRLRLVEVKHSRVAMLAFAGNIATRAGFVFNGDIDYHGTHFADIPNGFAGLAAMPADGAAQMFCFAGLLDMHIMKDKSGTAEFPGDFRNGWFNVWDEFSAEDKLKKRSVELNNGRAAMMGILGLMMHEKIGGSFPIIGEM